MEKVLVRLKDLSYPILLAKDELEDIGSILRRSERVNRVIIITDSQVGKLYLEIVKKGFKVAGYQTDSLIIPAGEESKDIKYVMQIYDQLLELKVDRSGLLAALGGGVVGDLTGFVAATYLRGINYIQIPTTLVAQVDSAIGGKTGINLPRGKNLIGAFWHPRFIFSDITTLKTLGEREFTAGLAEVIKYGVIMDQPLFEYLEGNADKILARNDEDLYYLVKRCSQNKAEIVEEDAREEKGIRTILNFGHTIGHALETSTYYRNLLHGEAVSVGMVFAAELSRRLGICPNGSAERIRRLIERFRLPTQMPAINETELLEIIQADKKMSKGKINFVFVKDIGKAVVQQVDIEKIFG